MLFPGTRSDFLLMCRAPGTYKWMATSDLAASSGNYTNENTYMVAFSNKIQLFQLDDPIVTFRAAENPNKALRTAPPPVPKWDAVYPCYLVDLGRVPDDVVVKQPLVYNTPAIEETQAGKLTINGEAFPHDAHAQFTVKLGPTDDEAAASLFATKRISWW